MSTKQIKLKHGITELGNLQVYRTTEIIEDGKIISSSMEQPYTPANVNNMDDFDQKSKDIVSAIIDKRVKEDFEIEKQTLKKIGLETIVTYDRMVEDDGKIAVRQITRIFDYGVEKTKKYHRSWIMPGDNSDKADVMSKAVAKKMHTKKIIKDFKLKLKENDKKI